MQGDFLAIADEKFFGGRDRVRGSSLRSEWNKGDNSRIGGFGSCNIEVESEVLGQIFLELAPDL